MRTRDIDGGSGRIVTKGERNEEREVKKWAREKEKPSERKRENEGKNEQKRVME